MSDETPTGSLFIPNRIRRLIEALPPKTLKKLSFHDLDLIEKFDTERMVKLEKDLAFYRQRRGELVIERDNALAQVAELEREIAELKARPRVEFDHEKNALRRGIARHRTAFRKLIDERHTLSPAEIEEICTAALGGSDD